MSGWNTTVKCVKEFNPSKGTIIGQTYNIENSRITYDNGMKSFNEYNNIEELNRGNIAKFKEVKRRGRPLRALIEEDK